MIIILMEILDDELIYKITWSPDCQATFKKYKKKILRKIKEVGLKRGIESL